MSQALLLVLATIASIGGIPTSLTNNSASLPCQRPWLKAEALPVSLPLASGISREAEKRIGNAPEVKVVGCRVGCRAGGRTRDLCGLQRRFDDTGHACCDSVL